MFGKHQIRDNIDVKNLVQDSQKKQNNTKQRKKNKRHQFSGEN